MPTQEQLVSRSVCCGLELEYEGISHAASHKACATKFSGDTLLNFKSDGSLRPRERSTEMVFVAPLAGSLVFSALDQVKYLVENLDYALSWRTGMHVHIDFRGMGFGCTQILGPLLSIMEPTFFVWDGTGRQENKFCQPISASVLSYVPNNGNNRGKNAQGGLTKYSSVNMYSLRKLGSLELRFASSTKSVPRMLEFINIGIATREVVNRFDTPHSLLDSVFSAPSLGEWIMQHYHPLVNRILADAAEVAGIPAASAFAAQTLGECLPTSNVIIH